MALLTDRFKEALIFATERHHGQHRKGMDVPYVSHLLGTCALALEAGADEDQAIAALLHDTLEDGKATYHEILELFGERVARIVRECSDSEAEPKPPWRQRKEAYIAALGSHGDDTLLVSAADKLHNLRTIASDYRQEGEELWRRFNPEADPIWYYSELVALYRQRRSPLAAELEATLDDLLQQRDLKSSLSPRDG